jgi:hypothetical protein
MKMNKSRLYSCAISNIDTLYQWTCVNWISRSRILPRESLTFFSSPFLRGISCMVPVPKLPMFANSINVHEQSQLYNIKFFRYHLRPRQIAGNHSGNKLQFFRWYIADGPKNIIGIQIPVRLDPYPSISFGSSQSIGLWAVAKSAGSLILHLWISYAR